MVWAAMHFVERWIIPLRKSGYVLCWFTQTNPHPVIFFLNAIDFCARGNGRFLGRMRWEANALPFFIIRPAVIWTYERLIFYFPQGEPRAAMHTEVAPRVNSIAGAP